MQDGAHDPAFRIHEGDARARRHGSGPERREERADPDERHRHVRLFLQSPSFLHAQRQFGTRRGRAGALALFGIGTIACAGQFRRTPDGVPPGHAGPLFHHVHAELERSGALAPLCRAGGRLLVAAGGTEYVSSTEIGCPNRRAQEKKDGSIGKYHAMTGAGIVVPGGSGPLPLPPGLVRPRDGAGKQDCELVAARRWSGRVGPRGGKAEAGPSGDDIHCCRPIREAMRSAGGNVLPTCRPGSRTTPCEWIQGARIDSLRRTERSGRKRKCHYHTRWMHDLPLGDGADAMHADRLGAAGAPENGGRLCHGSLATDLPAGRDDIAEPAACARARRSVENSVFGELKKLCHPEHDSGHGKATLASVPATFDLITLLMQSACEMVCDGWQAARRRLVARCRMPDHMKLPACHVVLRDRDEYLLTITTNELPEHPP